MESQREESKPSEQTTSTVDTGNSPQSSDISKSDSAAKLQQTRSSDPITKEPTSTSSPINEASTSEATPPLNTASEVNTLEQVEMGTAVEAMDENLDQALGHAADSIWNFASAVTGTVTNVVREGQPGFDNFRKNVTSRLAPLDSFGRDLSSQIGALAPNDASIAKITGSMKSVADSVQRNAEAMEAAILAKANAPGDGNYFRAENDGKGLTEGQNSEIALGDPAVGLLALGDQRGEGEEGEEEIDVNEEIAKVGETIQNSLIGQTVGDLWTGLWGMGDVGDEDANQAGAAMPKTRFEKRIFELQANPDTYCEPAKDLDAFEQWSKGFALDDHADSCIAILDTHDSIADLYERVVPRIVDEDTFWMRYFFAKHVLEKEEERRKKLLERAENAVADGEEDGWGDDDWGDENDSGGNGESKHVEESSEGTGASPEVAQSQVPRKGGADDFSQKAQASNVLPSSNVINETGTDSKVEDDWGDDDWE